MDFAWRSRSRPRPRSPWTGQIVGTPFFMSPEQAGGKTVDARSDIYSLGVSYYYLLTGSSLSTARTSRRSSSSTSLHPESPKIYTPELPENVCEVIRRCLKKKKKERYQSAAQLSKDLRAIAEGGELSAPRIGAEADGVPGLPRAPTCTRVPTRPAFGTSSDRRST